jgi:hypothetical protein
MANKKITELMAGTPTRDSLIESATDVGGTTVSRKFEVGAVVDLNNVQIASEYDDTATYAYGAYCIKDGVLYRCTTAISVAEAWTSAHWTAVMVTGEYKRVRIMTKAQFDLLSNDEKDGFIYVSDYPTKIQDIDNVNLTTSDNNKLLGVSVSGSDISVGAVGVETGTFTAGTNITVLRSSLYKLGNIKFLSVIFLVTGTATSVGTVSTGFEATYNIDFTAMSDSNNYARFRIQNGRNSVDISTTPQQSTYYAFTISYI